eukprot:357494-Chlamydomonas_euryale.AAC.9
MCALCGRMRAYTRYERARGRPATGMHPTFPTPRMQRRGPQHTHAAPAPAAPAPPAHTSLTSTQYRQRGQRTAPDRCLRTQRLRAHAGAEGCVRHMHIRARPCRQLCSPTIPCARPHAPPPNPLQSANTANPFPLVSTPPSRVAPTLQCSLLPPVQPPPFSAAPAIQCRPPVSPPPSSAAPSLQCRPRNPVSPTSVAPSIQCSHLPSVPHETPSASTAHTLGVLHPSLLPPERRTRPWTPPGS